MNSKLRKITTITKTHFLSWNSQIQNTFLWWPSSSFTKYKSKLMRKKKVNFKCIGPDFFSNFFYLLKPDEFPQGMINETASHNSPSYGMLSQYSVFYSLKIILLGLFTLLINLPCPVSCRKFIGTKVNLNFYCHTYLCYLKSFYEGLYGLHKTFWGTTKCENKISRYFSLFVQDHDGKG